MIEKFIKYDDDRIKFTKLGWVLYIALLVLVSVGTTLLACVLNG